MKSKGGAFDPPLAKKCVVACIDIPVKVIILISITIAITISINAVVPVLQVSKIQSIFRSAIFFNNPMANPMTNTFSLDYVDRVHDTFYPMSPTNDIYEKLQRIRNITTKPEIFDYTEISYYGNSALCVQNIFKNQVRNQTAFP